MEKTNSEDPRFDLKRAYAVKEMAAILKITTRTLTKWAEPIYKQHNIKKRTKILPPVLWQAILAFLGYI